MEVAGTTLRATGTAPPTPPRCTEDSGTHQRRRHCFRPGAPTVGTEGVLDLHMGIWGDCDWEWCVGDRAGAPPDGQG